jgi:hypothetical protein
MLANKDRDERFAVENAAAVKIARRSTTAPAMGAVFLWAAEKPQPGGAGLGLLEEFPRYRLPKHAPIQLNRIVAHVVGHRSNVSLRLTATSRNTGVRLVIPSSLARHPDTRV